MMKVAVRMIRRTGAARPAGARRLAVVAALGAALFAGVPAVLATSVSVTAADGPPGTGCCIGERVN